jgi:cytochrome oxidase Cu insertion factor (SCO1/SenC/PrrC family)
MKGKGKNPQKSRKESRGQWLPFAVVGASLAVAAAVLILTLFVAKRKQDATRVAPEFVLHDQQDRLTSLAEFRGKVVVLTFIDPECAQICPLTTQSMVEALKMLGPDAASRVQLLGIDANPLKTQVADVAAYTRTHELQDRWRFLTGSRAQLESVWRGYNVYVTTAANDDVVHEAVIFLIDGNGNERASYTTPMSYASVRDQARTLAQGIARLLPGHPSLSKSSQASQPPDQPLQPGETVSLQSLGPKRQPVALGTSHPHLVVFFAGWLGQDSDLSKDLAALDSYADLAQRQGWPSPVAVDEVTTEPSPAEARQLLAGIAVTLHTPIVEDASGRLADAYHVEDLPWFVLTSPSGNILWRRDGWVSADVLNQNARTALAAH